MSTTTSSQDTKRRTARHYAGLADAAHALALLKEARAALPAEFFELAGRIDDVIHATAVGRP